MVRLNGVEMDYSRITKISSPLRASYDSIKSLSNIS